MLIHDDCIQALKNISDNSIDSLITDPPAGISFMGKDWDSGNNFIPAMTEIFKETLRVLKPGAHGLVWALPRTSHWTATALEQAGFEIRDVVTHIFGTGFPKSLDISKAIDKAAGVEREIISEKPYTNQNIKNNHLHAGHENIREQTYFTSPSTIEAKQWQGWGTALKPASEHWIMVRKPISEKTIAANVLKWGTGGMNIDESRISTENAPITKGGCTKVGGIFGSGNAVTNPEGHIQGRFPANLVLDEVAAEMLDEMSGPCKTGDIKAGTLQGFGGGINTYGTGVVPREFKTDAATGASRFFYVAKASKKDRNEGLEGMPEKESTVRMNNSDERHEEGREPTLRAPQSKNQNFHPTVKATKLMEYLIKLITPPNGVILDPFMGSGSTGVAAKRLGFEFIGIEKNQEYFEIAERRIS